MVLVFHDELISSQESHPLLKSPPYNLTLSVTELTTPKVPKNKNRATENEEDVIIPRPHNAFIIFRNDFAARLKDSPDKKISIRLISQMASKQWKQETEEVRFFFKLLADMYQHKHRILYPDYKYSPKYNSARKRRKSKNAKSKNQDFKGKKKGRIITWYIHDNTDKDLYPEKSNNMFRYSGLNIFNLEDVTVQTENPCKQNYPPATFINYTATPTTPLVLHSTTTTCSQPVPIPTPPVNFRPYDVNRGSLYDVNEVNEVNNDGLSDSASSYYDDAMSPLSFINMEPVETLSPYSSPPSEECLFWENSSNNERDIPSSPFFYLTDNQTIFEM